jgi:hypothetical protein
MVRALGMSMGGARSRQGDHLYQFVTQRSLRPYVPKDLPSRMGAPIRFKAPTGCSLATGYEATILPDICEAVLAARKADALQADQKYVAQKCKVLVRGLARVGIIALIDETTGYQRDCAKDALAKILDEFIAKELQPWVRTFPDDFYQEMFRLRGLEFPRDSVKRPQYFGALTNDIIYKRLAPGVLDELKKATLRAEYGRRKDALPWRLARNIGYPKLRELLGSVVAIMKLSKSWAPFMNKLNRLHPRHGKPTQTSFDFETDDDGKGL